MAVEIPFRRDLVFEYAKLEPVAPGIRRIVANNPGPFTFNFVVPGLTAPNLHHGGPPPDHDANPDVTAVLQ